jgi:hypothetical protein
MFDGQERIVFSPDWLTIVFLVILLLIAIIKNNFSEQLSSLFSLLYSDKYYSDFGKVKPLIWNNFNILFFLIFILVSAVMIYYSLNAYVNDSFRFDLGYFLKILAGVLIYLVLRYTFEVILSSLFEIFEEYKFFSFVKLSNLFLISVYLLPALLFVTYVNSSQYVIFIGAALIFLALVILFRYIKALQYDRINFSNVFYLFLYLCALEIAPIILIYKLIVS